jgi:hypothetical protein
VVGQCGLAALFRKAVESGELPERVDPVALAAFFVTVQQGMSIQARDGASEEALLKIAQSAMAAWEPLTAP